MDIGFVWQLALLAAVGIGGGLWLLGRGMAEYRHATRIGDTAPSRIASLAAGEVQVTGVIEPAELTLVSPLQSATCVYYRSRIDAAGDGPDLDADFHEERAVGFRVRDATGEIRVFPRGARWDAPIVFDDTTGMLGDEPAGLALRAGNAIAATGLDHEVAVAALLTVQPTSGMLGLLGASAPSPYGMGSRKRRRYREARLVPGEAVTIMGRALPFSDLSDPAEADVAVGSVLPDDDPEVTGDIAEARSVGLLEDSPEEAWGNAAIPGFGIGRPVREAAIDPAATPLPIAPPGAAAEAERRFTIPPETLVLASAPGTPLLIVHGSPSAAVARHEGRFLLGLLGAVVAIVSAMVLAIIVAGMIGR